MGDRCKTSVHLHALGLMLEATNALVTLALSAPSPVTQIAKLAQI